MSDILSHGSIAEAATPSAATRLSNLNFDYLQLLVAELQESSASARTHDLNPEWVSKLARAPDSRLQELAGCGLSLFTLSLQNTQLWRRMAVAGKGDTVAARYAGEAPGQAVPCLVRRSALVECVLFYAWHLTQTDRAAARICLGLGDEVAALIGNFEPWQIRRAALDYPQLLAARWPNNACFWPDLIQFVCSGDRQHLDYARLLGTQLLAQELEPSAIGRLTSLRRNLQKGPRNPRS